MNQSREEHLALAKRAKYELRQSYFTKNYNIAIGYAKLLKKLGEFKISDSMIASLAMKKVNISGIYNKLKKPTF